MKKKIYIIGFGKTGTSFYFELKDKGYEVYFISDKNAGSSERLKNETSLLNFSDKIKKDFIKESDVILICVQDRYIKDAVNTIINFNTDLSKKIMIHVSGSVSTEVFERGSINPENTVSMHPIQTFDKISIENNHLLEKIYFGIEGGHTGKEYAKEIIASFDSNFIEIPKDKKHLYHSACVVSSNFLITLLNISSEIMGSIGIEKNKTFEIFRPIIERTLENISEDGLVNSLTGPFERNDLETISNHLNSINKELPSLIPFYTLLGMETVKVAFKKESINMKNVISVLDLMNEYIINESNSVNKTIN
ncbi:MAG TPA: DUF2520 domain-containing protein [Ignavibacteria bacterium]|nr:DUF2520 domain-containing protein [Ignavibacteria bacterium]